VARLNARNARRTFAEARVNDAGMNGVRRHAASLEVSSQVERGKEVPELRPCVRGDRFEPCAARVAVRVDAHVQRETGTDLHDPRPALATSRLRRRWSKTKGVTWFTAKDSSNPSDASFLCEGKVPAL
jgi:hypothetical protein